MEITQIFLLFLAICPMALAIQCGVTFFEPNITGTRIVGGTQARPNSYPWMGSVQKMDGKTLTHFCGATLIRASDKIEASDLVLTAAHCLYGGPALYVALGAHSLSKPSAGQQLSKVVKSAYHPDYNSSTVQNDFAILKLEKPVSFSKTIQPACLPGSGESLSEGARGIVSGWGLIKEGTMDYPDLLQQAVLPIYNTDQCIASLKQDGLIVLKNIQFCAGYPKGGIDSCSEDSGGPWVLRNSQRHYVLHGVVSYGVGCAHPNKPGVYTKVSNYIPWITQKIKELSSLKNE